MVVGIRYANHATALYPKKLAVTSPTRGGRSAGIVRSRTKATELLLLQLSLCLINKLLYVMKTYGIPRFLYLEMSGQLHTPGN
jgi:hypothetical protein